MATAARYPQTTFDEFCVLVKDGQKADLIDGVIYLASPDNTNAAAVGGWLYFLLFGFASVRQLGPVYVSRVAFRLDLYNSPEPDISFVRQARSEAIQRGYVLGGPDLAVEIVSPDSVDRDYRNKRLQYQQAGVREYWILDEMQKTHTFLRLDNHGRFRTVKPRKGEFHSEALPGFWFRPEWLWQEPLPEAFAVLQQILARQP